MTKKTDNTTYVARPKGKPETSMKGKMNEWSNGYREFIPQGIVLQDGGQEGVELLAPPERGRQERRPRGRDARAVSAPDGRTAQGEARAGEGHCRPHALRQRPNAAGVARHREGRADHPYSSDVLAANRPSVAAGTGTDERLPGSPS